MRSFATIDDLERRWRPLTEDEAARAAHELEDASAFLAALLERKGIGVDPFDEVQTHNLKVCTCNVVRRAMAADQTAADSFPYDKHTEQAGVFSETYEYANPMGDKYLTRAEMRMLGIKRMRIGQLFVSVGNHATR